MDDFKTVSDDKANLVGETVYYDLTLSDNGVIMAVPVDYPVEVVSGILQREVIKGIKGCE